MSTSTPIAACWSAARRARSLVAGAAALALTALAPLVPVTPATAADVFSPEQKKAIETIIKDYLVANPELFLEIQGALEQKMEKVQAEKLKVALKENAADIYRRPDAPFAGNPNGDITVVEFFDYNCGYCKRGLSDIAKLVENDPKVRVVFKELPILSKGSEEAARVALAARIQGKYWEVHRGLLEAKGQVNEAAVAQDRREARPRHGQAQDRHGRRRGEGRDRARSGACPEDGHQRHAALPGRRPLDRRRARKTFIEQLSHAGRRLRKTRLRLLLRAACSTSISKQCHSTARAGGCNRWPVCSSALLSTASRLLTPFAGAGKLVDGTLGFKRASRLKR